MPTVSQRLCKPSAPRSASGPCARVRFKNHVAASTRAQRGGRWFEYTAALRDGVKLGYPEDETQSPSPAEVTAASRNSGTKRIREDTQGHEQDANQVREDTGGPAGY